MIYIVNVSGGLASFEALHRTIERYGKEQTVALFADTLIEDADLYRFLDDQERVFGIEITRLSDGRTPFGVWIATRMIRRIVNGKRLAKCSLLLKTQIINSHIAREYAGVANTRVFGYTWDETHRMEALSRNLAPVECWFPLSEPPYVDKCDIANICQQHGIQPPRLYAQGFAHNNCGGGCVWAGQAHWAHVYRTLPDVYARWEAEEQRFQKETGTSHTILSVAQRYGKPRPMSLREFRETVLDVQAEFDVTEFGGCGCFASGYEDEAVSAAQQANEGTDD
jgi:3'-phosphoadenosine 5'-phosphosulfate sulfotransferase (PAPS reductase)/FAD synthetase